MFGIVPKIQSKVLSYHFWPKKIRQFLSSETGPFTVFFWAPVIKVGIITANINDYYKPVEQISSKLQFVLLCSGFIWTRWCLIVSPKLYMLGLCNFVMGNTAAVQLYRKFQAGQLLE